MKKYIVYCTILVAILFSCKDKTHNRSNLNTNNLTSSFITLKADSSYTLKTSKGAILKIPANAFDAPAGSEIKLELKEAYSMQDILLAGLTTRSNGKLLQSGGMLYINAKANDKDLSIVKPITAEIPTDNYNDSMKVFKGEVKDDSTINWVDPKPLDTSIAFENTLLLDELFKTQCGACHKAQEDFTGPALVHCRDREPDPEWAYRFVNNTNKMLSTDPYAKALHAKYASVMPQFNLPKEQIKMLLDYCDFYAPQVPSQPATTTAIEDTCFTYDTTYISQKDTSTIQVLPKNATIDGDSVTFKQKYYQFSIDACGWYNIDCFINNNIDNITNVSLSASIHIPDSAYYYVQLCIPERKLLTGGHYDNTSKKYFFYSSGDTIPLILNDNATIVVTGTGVDTFYYGIANFKVSPSQVISIDVHKSSKENILQSIKNNKLGDLKIDIDAPEIVTTLKLQIDTTYVQSVSNTDSSGKEVKMQIEKIPCTLKDSTATK
ncbi:c-type cytochrome [Ferruginibacter albus]|uniref:c-type cytochrome n=1 Tax=Ferruginibacter albus TaxID=2875540 RepID=UPI001CC7A46F|nr:cytochrome c [Ferruginibacter albus]UAY53614.1 cytochrome c [Ferruginibacter albus]